MKLIIECNGLPGAGKTTVLNEVKKRLKKTDYAYSDFFLLETKKSRTKLAFLKLVLIRGLVKNHKITIAYIKLFIRYLFRKKQMRIVASALRNALLLKEFVENECIILSDQTIVQDLQSIFYDEKIERNEQIYKIITTIADEFPELVLLNFDIDVDIAAERIKNRTTNESRLDRVSFERKKQLLEIHDENLKIIRSLFKDSCQIVIDSRKAVNYSVDRIMSELSNIQALRGDN